MQTASQTKHTCRMRALHAIIESLHPRNRWNMFTASSSLIGCRAAATRYNMLCRIPPIPLTTLAFLSFPHKHLVSVSICAVVCIVKYRVTKKATLSVQCNTWDKTSYKIALNISQLLKLLVKLKVKAGHTPERA